MAVIKKTLFAENLDRYQTFVTDTNPTSEYFKITELSDTFTGGKNAFLIQGSEYLVPDTLIKIEIKDSQGNIIYHEPGEGIVSSSVGGTDVVTEYYEGVSKVVSVHIYPDTTYGPATITILGELSTYNNNGLNSPIPLEWEGKYNVKWQKQITANPSLANTTKIRFYRRPVATITETLSPIYTIISGSKVESNIVSSFANITLSKLDTFAGDVKRIKVYRTSEGDISDYDMIQDILLESKELLTSYNLTGSVVGEAGLMTSEVLEKLWSYPTLTTELTSSRIDNGVKLDGNGYFTFTSSLHLSANSVYEFGIDGFYSASTNSDMGIYVSGSNNGEMLVGTLNGVTPTKNLKDTVFQFTLPLDEPTASLYLSQSQSEWHIGNLSLKLTEDTAFSPSEISFVTSMPTVVGNETYNFKFEFYDVNNNYVPVLVTQSALFTGGNNNIGGTLNFISASASSSLGQLYAVSSSISGTATLYSSSANTTIVTLSGSVSGSIVSLSGSVSGSINTLSGSVSGSINSLSGSVSASLTSLSASVSSSNALVLSSSFAQVKNLANGQFSGSFIGDTVIYSPTIGGQQGYIKELFTVGDNTAGTINLDARTTNRRIYIGDGNYNNTDTSVYLDGAGKFSLKDKLSFDGTTLSVNGIINVTGGNASTTTYADGVASTAQTNAINTAASDATTKANTAFNNAKAVADSIANGTYSGGTLISSNSIISPVIAGGDGYISNIFKVGSGGITLDGTNKKIYIGSGTYANTNTGFYVDSSGNFSLKDKLTWNGTTLTVAGTINANAGTFSGNITSTATITGGTISGGVISGGRITIGSNFSVDTAGNVSATNANLTGTISATAGTIGGWTITGTGYLQNSTGKLKINPATPSIEIYDANDAKRLDIHYGSLTFLGSNSVYIDPPGISLPNISGITGNVDSGYVYSGGASFYVGQAGTYQKQVNWSAVNSIGYVSNSFSSYFSIGRGVEIRDGSGNVVGNLYAPGGGTDGGGGGGEYFDWPAYTYYASISFPSAGTYYAYTYYYYYGYLSSGVYADINGGYWDQGTVGLDMENNLVEITDAGIQIAKNPNQFLRFPRDFGETIIDGKGVASFTANNSNDYAIRCVNSETNPDAGNYGDAMYLWASDRSIYISTGNIWMASSNAFKPGGGSWGNSSSDRRVKQYENELSGSLDIIKALKPKTFEYKQQNRPDVEKGTQIGFIAQDVEEVRPEWVEVVQHKSGSCDILAIDPTYYDENKSGSVDIKTVSFGTDMTAILVGAIKELTAKVEMLEAKLSGSI